MDPNFLKVFNAIQAQSIVLLTKILQETSASPWFLNEDNLSALEFAAQQPSQDASLAILDTVQSTARAAHSHTVELELMFQYALLKIIKRFCGTIERWDDFFLFYEYPNEKIKISLLASVELQTASSSKQPAQSWTEWGYDLVAKTVPSTFNDVFHVMPTMRAFIRSEAVAHGIKSRLTMLNNQPAIQSLNMLHELFRCWIDFPLFNTHRNLGKPYLTRKDTNSVTMFRKLLTALDKLIANKGKLPNDFTLEQAQEIMLLCAKCYPFSPKSLQTYWKDMANELLTKFQNNNEAVKTLFRALLDKQFLYTDSNIPFASDYLIGTIDLRHVITAMNAYQLRSAAQALKDGSPVQLIPAAEGMDILALYPLPPGRKWISLSGNKLENHAESTEIDPKILQFLHLVLMNNESVTCSIPKDPLFETNPLQYFPQSRCQITLVVFNQTQLLLLPGQIHVLMRTHARVGISMPKALLADPFANPHIHDIQRHMGPKQTLSVQLIDGPTTHRLLADMVVRKHDIAPGPYSSSPATHERSSFREIYDKLSWTQVRDASAIETAYRNRTPLFFKADAHIISPEFLQTMKRILTLAGSEVMFLRVQDMDSSDTKCDFIISKDQILTGPLFNLALCTDPGMFATATANPSAAVAKVLRIGKEKEAAKAPDQAADVLGAASTSSTSCTP